MTRKTQTTKRTQPANDVAVPNIVVQTNRDMMTALLIVSLVVNLFVLVGWVTLQVTTTYDAQVASFLFTR